jgi:anionic cell wall polymer biosynthesis LytR-Cps2A-Psr (LCP) family protein
LTGLNLENYIIVDTDALIKIVDAIGGVTFDVPIDMNYEDSGQDLYIHLTAGEQLIDGAKAEQLLRFRHNDDGSTYPASYGMEDMGRTRTQRAFVVATLKQVLKPQNIFKLKQIVDIASANVTTNMTLSDLKSYIPYAVNFDTENIKTDVVPGTSEMCNGVSIYVANKTKTAEIVAELFSEPEEETEQEEQLSENITTTTNNETTTSIKVEVLNGSGSSSILSEVVTKLENAGYKVIKQGTTNETAKTTITNKTNQTTTEANKIKDLLGTGTITKGSNNSNVDFSIIIGQDYK